jgi:hypothetical protein
MVLISSDLLTNCNKGVEMGCTCGSDGRSNKCIQDFGRDAPWKTKIVVKLK